jgi:hypothetical protein
LSVSLGHNFPPITVEVAVPVDGSLDLSALQLDLLSRVKGALAEVAIAPRQR